MGLRRRGARYASAPSGSRSALEPYVQVADLIAQLGLPLELDLRGGVGTAPGLATGCEGHALRREEQPDHASRSSGSPLLDPAPLAPPRASGPVPTPPLKSTERVTQAVGARVAKGLL